jgi:UDPglucose 6-dehydrogenase
LIEALLAAGANVVAHDPVAMDEARRHLEDGGDRVSFAASNYAAVDGADALVVVTDWNEYRHPDFARIKMLLKRPLIIDGRNLYSLDLMSSLGFSYHSIGRPSVTGARPIV